LAGNTSGKPTEPLSPQLAPGPENRRPAALPADPALARVMAAWPDLPKPIRRAVLALVESGR
jgi:hypothetical protein